MEGVTLGSGPAMTATVLVASNPQPALSASTKGNGAAAVQATATGSAGRGAIVSGKAAQIQLVPSTAASHPSSGQAGDLFVDSSARLWFCTATGSPATWNQVQVI